MKFKDIIVYNEMMILKPEKTNLKFLELKIEEDNEDLEYYFLKSIDISKINSSKSNLPFINEIPLEYKNIFKQNYNSNKSFKERFDNNLKKIKEFISNKNTVLYCLENSEAFFIQENEIFLINLNPDDSISFASRSLDRLKSFMNDESYSLYSRPKINTNQSLSKIFDIIEFLCKKKNWKDFLIKGQDKARHKLYEKFLPKRFKNVIVLKDHFKVIL